MNTIQIPAHVTESEALSALLIAALKALSAESWNAQTACERMTHERGVNAIRAIAEARVALDEAELHARAIREYESRLRDVRVPA